MQREVNARFSDPMYLEGTCPIPWRMRFPLERIARSFVREKPFEPLVGLPGPAPVTIAAAGDLSMERMPSYDADDILNDVRPFWDSADLRVANLESQCTDRDRPAIPAKGMRAPGKAAEFVRAARIDAVTVANNHALDFGSSALAESVARMHGGGIGVTGFGDDASPHIIEKNGLRIGMLAWCDHYRPPEHEAIDARPALVPGEAAMLSSVRELRSRCDVVLVQLHWGYEFVLHPLLRHRDLARRVAEAGAQVVLCHHAHVPMAVEMHGASVVAHGMGNWIFADRPYFRENHDWTFRSYLLKVGTGPDGVHSVEVEPFVLGPDSRIHRMAGRERQQFLAGLSRMNARIGDTDWLTRVQQNRAIFEAVNVADQLQRGNIASVRERARLFSIPVGRDHIEDLRALHLPSADWLADWFAALAEAAENPERLQAVWFSGKTEARQNTENLRSHHDWKTAFRSRIP